MQIDDIAGVELESWYQTRLDNIHVVRRCFIYSPVPAGRTPCRNGAPEIYKRIVKLISE